MTTFNIQDDQIGHSDKSKIFNTQQINWVQTLVKDLYLLQNIGKLERVEINLVNYEDSRAILIEEFRTYSRIGLYLDGVIYLYCAGNDLPDFHMILHKIGKLMGTFEVIESISVVLRTTINEKPIEFVVDVVGEYKIPKLVSVNEMIYYFHILNYFSTKWLLIKNEPILKLNV